MYKQPCTFIYLEKNKMKNIQNPKSTFILASKQISICLFSNPKPAIVVQIAAD